MARGDLAIVGIFTVARGKQAAIAAGTSPAEAIRAGSIPFVIAQSATLLWPVAVIALIDRLPWLGTLGFGMLLGAIGCLGMSAVGGWAFDHVGPAKPFHIASVPNALVGVAAFCRAAQPALTDMVKTPPAARPC